MKKLAWIAMLVLAAPAALAGSYDELNAGIQAYNLKQWDAAVSHLDTALAAGDLTPGQTFVAHLDRGAAQFNLKHDDLAVADYSAALRMRPDEVAILAVRVVTYLRMKNYVAAAADLDALIAQRPADAGFYTERAAIDLMRKDSAKADKDFKQAMALLPATTLPGRNVGLIAWQAGDLVSADENFRAGINQRGGDVYSWIWFGLTEVRLGKDLPRQALPKTDHAKWPGPIVDFLLGDKTQEAVFAAAAQGDEQAVTGQVCEANFYMGEWLLRHGHDDAAAPMLRKAAADCPLDFVEWAPAQLEVANLP